ncbi:MAG TPA: FliG C-terminal domain-containing protein, partial [Hyphomonas sp.]|nr:FliG C-terminal domain-containing protein [Hyphomonas sp.]
GAVSRESLEQFADEMSREVAKGGAVRVGVEEVEAMLTGVVKPEQLATIMSGLRPNTIRSVWLRLEESPEGPLTQFLLGEHPQIAAFILSKVSSAVSANVLRQIPSANRSDIVRRILSVRPVATPAVNLIEAALDDVLATMTAKSSGPPVHARVADIINKMERQQMEEVLSDLDQSRPKDAKLVKGLLFTFDDIGRLSAPDRVKLFDGIPTDRTILALHGVEPGLRELVLAALSSRARRMIEQELSGSSGVAQREITRARRAIADMALELADRGVIDLGRQKDDR